MDESLGELKREEKIALRRDPVSQGEGWRWSGRIRKFRGSFEAVEHEVLNLETRETRWILPTRADKEFFVRYVTEWMPRK